MLSAENFVYSTIKYIFQIQNGNDVLMVPFFKLNKAWIDGETHSRTASKYFILCTKFPISLKSLRRTPASTYNGSFY